MAEKRPPLDSSLKDRIASPSAEFRDFLDQYFLIPMYSMRNEQDETILDRLQGVERNTAIEMILSNLHSGRTHIIDAVARLNIRSAIPALHAMRAENFDDYEQYVIARALHALGSMDGEHLLSLSEETLGRCGDFVASTILADSYQLFSANDAQRLIEIGLRRDDYHIRAAAYRAAVAVHYVRTHGGHFTENLADELWKKEMASATVGAPPPMFYQQLQYYVGDAVYADSTLFERRLAELWDNDPQARRVALFTELG